MLNVLWNFFVLGLYSFGGPAAHIGYFQREFVENKKWLKQNDFTHAVALCQFLPGPASSQLGMYIGFKRAGYLGAIAAFIGFTLPSFVLLTFLAIANNQVTGMAIIETVIHAAKLLAVVVVADALWGMAKKNVTSLLTLFVASLTAIWVFFSSGLLGQVAPIMIAALVGYLMSFRNTNGAVNTMAIKNDPIRPNVFIISVFVGLLIGLPLVANQAEALNLMNVFYQAGSFVFGGGHVVLPLLEPMMEGMVEPDTFLTSYAAAQLVPGPMFTMASYLGASALPSMPILGSFLATVAVFLPGCLLLFAFLPAWKALFSHSRLKVSIVLVNASVIGLLGSAFVTPVITTSISSIFDLVSVIIGYVLLKYKRCPVWLLAVVFVVYKVVVDALI